MISPNPQSGFVRRLGRARARDRADPSGKWVGPDVLRIGTGSVGFPARHLVSEGVTMVMTEKGFNSLSRRRSR